MTNLTVSTTTMPMTTKLGRVVTYLEGLQIIKSDNAWRVPIATKLGSMVTYLDGLLTIKSHDPLIM